MINLDLYRVFYTVAKCGSLTKASEELYISQPAVSQSIKNLESQLGGKLFNRVSRGMELTETGGRQIFEIVERAIKLLDSAELKFKESKNIATGVLKISAGDTYVKHFLLRYIKKFHELYPNVVITFKDANTKETLDRIKSHKADIGLVNLPIYDDDVLLTGQTGVIEDIFVATEKFAELFDSIVDLRDLPDYPIIMLDANTSSNKEIMSFFGKHGITITPEFEAGSIELVIEMAKNGMGIACVPRRYVLEELAKKELYEIKVSPALPTRATGVVLNKDVASHSFALKEFIKILDVDQYNQGK